VLHHLIYASQPADGLEITDIQAIASSARRRNAALGVTGFLVFRHDLFMQVIEGGQAEVSEVFCRIARDVRHRDLLLLSFGEIEVRSFGESPMGMLAISPRHRSIIVQHSSHDELRPSDLSASRALALLAALAATARDEAPPDADAPAPNRTASWRSEIARPPTTRFRRPTG
jgi:hypothetical protein